MSVSVRPEDSAYIREWLRASQDPAHPDWQTPGAPARGAHTGPAPTGLAKVVLDRYVTRRLSHGRRPHRAEYWASEVEQAQAIAARWSRVRMPPEDVVRWIAALSAASAEQAAALFAEGIHPEDLAAGTPSLGARLVVGNLTVDDVIGELRAG